MQTMVIDTVVRDNVIAIPSKFKNRHVKIIIIDSEEQEKKKKLNPRKLNFKIDASLEDVVPFADILDSRQFVDKLRKDQWQFPCT
jgi:hypothetical protein